MRYEYKLIPAPAEPPKVKGVRGVTARYLHGLQEVLNEMGAAGWDYVRCDRMPVTASRGFLRRKEQREEVVLVFRRARDAAPAAEAPAAPRAVAPRPVPVRPAAEPEPRTEPSDEAEDGEELPPVPEFMRPRGERRGEPSVSRRPGERGDPPVFSRRPVGTPRED